MLTIPLAESLAAPGNSEPPATAENNGGEYTNPTGRLQAQGKLAEAEPYFREALEGNRRVLGDDHPNTLIIIKNLIALYDVRGKPEKAAEWRAKLAEAAGSE